MVIAHHIILTGYGHWLPNDPRGSMSEEVYSQRLAELGPVHYGRKSVQPPTHELAAFRKQAQQRLAWPVLWWEDAQRRALVDCFGEVAAGENLTCYACAVIRNHAHLLIRVHRIRGQQMGSILKEAGRGKLIASHLAPHGHPVFSDDAGHYFKSSPEEVYSCAKYITDNYPKHYLEPIPCSWTVPYDGWHHRGSKRS